MPARQKTTGQRIFEEITRPETVEVARSVIAHPVVQTWALGKVQELLEKVVPSVADAERPHELTWSEVVSLLPEPWRDAIKAQEVSIPQSLIDQVLRRCVWDAIEYVSCTCRDDGLLLDFRKQALGTVFHYRVVLQLEGLHISSTVQRVDFSAHEERISGASPYASFLAWILRFLVWGGLFRTAMAHLNGRSIVKITPKGEGRYSADLSKVPAIRRVCDFRDPIVGQKPVDFFDIDRIRHQDGTICVHIGSGKLFRSFVGPSSRSLPKDSR